MSTNEEPMLLDVPLCAPPIGQRMRGLSPKQSAIVQYLRKNGTITTAQATELVGGNVYHNAVKHTGALLGNMVKRRIIKRIKVGLFSL
jgi:hypothetical protein